MTDGPIKLKSPQNHHPVGGLLKIKRGGTGKIGSSGNAARRVRSPGRALRDHKGKHLPWPPRGKAIWNPRDPFIIAYRKEHHG